MQNTTTNTVKLESINAEQFRSIVGNKFFSVNFVKKDNTLRKLTGRLDVSSEKYLRGGKDSTSHLDDLVNVWEKNNDKFYRKVAMSRVQQLTANGTTYVVGE